MSLRIPLIMIVMLSIFSLQAQAAQTPSTNVLVIGDSLSIGSTPYLLQMMPDTVFTVHHKGGQLSRTGIAWLNKDLRKETRKVVFAMGTNDARRSAKELRTNYERVFKLVKPTKKNPRCIVVLTIHSPIGAHLNEAVRGFRRGHPAFVRLADWDALVTQNPQFLGPDGVHSNPEGYAERARLIKRSLSRC